MDNMNLFFRVRSILPDWKKIVIGLGMSFFVLYMLSNTRADPDLWGYLAFGRLFWETGGFPYQDVFAYVPTKEIWIYHEWLTGVLFYPIYKSWGGAGLQLLKYILGFLTAVLVYVAARERGARPFPILIALFCVSRLFAYGYSPVRAQVFTYLFFVLYLYILETSRRDKRWHRLWWLVPIQLVWSNLHGGFLAGPGLLVLYALGESLSGRTFRPYLILLVASGLVTLINPYGINYWKYIIEAVSMDRRNIWEWHSMLRLMREGHPSIVYVDMLSMLILSSVFLFWRRKRDLTDIIVLATTAYLGVTHFRHHVFFLLAAAVYMPLVFTVFFNNLETHQQVVQFRHVLKGTAPLLFPACFAAFFGYHYFARSPLALETPPRQNKEDTSMVYYPIGAVEYIKTNDLSGNILPVFGWGEFILWTLYPSCRVGMDGRYETVYPEDLCKEYWEFHYGEDSWRTFLYKYPHDMIVVKTNSRTHKLLQNEPGWKEAYADIGCVLLLKERTGNDPGAHAKKRGQP